MSKARQSFIRRIRARIRVSWLLATAQTLAPFIGVTLFTLFLLDWLTAFDRALVFAITLVVAVVMLLVLRALTLRVTDWAASRAAERGLVIGDVLTSALEFSDADDQMHTVIQRLADDVADRSDPAKAIPFRPQPRSLMRFGVTVALALVIGFLPPLGSETALSVDIQTALDNEADHIQRLADSLRSDASDESDELASQLSQLAEDIRSARSLQEALEAIDATQANLDSQLDPSFMAQRAATRGLTQDLALRPLVPESTGDPASQFRALADQLDQMSPEEQAAAAQRLGDLADSQVSGNPDLASSLEQAADAMERGDIQTAMEMLDEAAQDHLDALSTMREQQRISDSQDTLDGAENRMGGDGDDSAGEEGEEGEGTGAGDGETEAAGEGGEGGQANDGFDGSGGEHSGEDAPEGARGGDHLPSGEPGLEDFDQIAEFNVFHPIDDGILGERVQVGIGGEEAEVDSTGLGVGVTTRGQSYVPFTQVLPQYFDEAQSTLARLNLPPSMRGIVLNYFDQLANEMR